MISRVTHVPLLVHDQNEALEWYTQKRGFEKRADDPFPGDPESRWVTIAPKGQTDMEIVLQPPAWGPGGDAGSRAQMVGKQPGWVVVTDDCHREYEELTACGVQFVSPPEDLPWGVSALFTDLYGNVHNLLEPRMPG
jgi:predicted enzyme related to lactoylglutathione lyase